MSSETSHLATQGPSRNGPADPFRPIGDPEVLTHTPSMSQVVRQRYADGCIYEYMVPVGYGFDAEKSLLIPIFKGRYLYSLTGEDRNNYISVWVPEEEGLVYEMVFDEASELPEFERSSPIGDPEVLFEQGPSSCLRIPYTNGWMCVIICPFGLPWPSLPLEVRQYLPTAPIVSVREDGLILHTRFWISEAAVPATPFPLPFTPEAGTLANASQN